MPKGIKMTQETFIKRLSQNFGEKYDFSITEFKGNNVDVEYICPKHGVVKTKAKTLLAGFGCKLCGREEAKKKMTMTRETFIQRSEDMHREEGYDYSKVIYINSETKVEIICPIHGSFWVLPRTHLSGHKCAKCMKKASDGDYFIERATKIHKGKYDYSKVGYISASEKVCIICPVHGEFWQTPNAHLGGSGCKKCYADKMKSEKRTAIYGVGVNDCFDELAENIWSYGIWFDMLRRCYSDKLHAKRPTYKGCTVCDEWLTFSNFRKWAENPDNGYSKGYHLDKDILTKGNKTYSPENCCFVPSSLNSITTTSATLRGELPIGVSKAGNRYRVRFSFADKLVNLGCFGDPIEAFNAYKEAKEHNIKELADALFERGEITLKVKEALYRYKVDIND